MYARTHARTQTHSHTRTATHAHAQAHTHTHAHMYELRQGAGFQQPAAADRQSQLGKRLCVCVCVGFVCVWGGLRFRTYSLRQLRPCALVTPGMYWYPLNSALLALHGASHMHTHTHACTRAHTHTYTHTHGTHTRTRTYAHTRANTHTPTHGTRTHTRAVDPVVDCDIP